MWDCEMRVMNYGSDNGYNNRDEEGDLSRCGELHCVFPLQSPSLGRAILSFCCLGKKTKLRRDAACVLASCLNSHRPCLSGYSSGGLSVLASWAVQGGRSIHGGEKRRPQRLALHLTEGTFSPARSPPGASSLRPHSPTKNTS